MSVLIDSNVLIDLVDPASSGRAWSIAQVERLADNGGVLLINPIIYAEVSVPFSKPSDVEALLAPFDREGLPFEAAFAAGKAFVAGKFRAEAMIAHMDRIYRKQGVRQKCFKQICLK